LDSSCLVTLTHAHVSAWHNDAAQTAGGVHPITGADRPPAASGRTAFSLEPMIDESLAKEAADALATVALGRWTRARTEIQDGGAFLLLSVDAPQLSIKMLDRKIRKAVAVVLNNLLPASREQPVGSWIVVFIRDGEVFESILPHQATWN
jgi:hypothetical protein